MMIGIAGFRPGRRGFAWCVPKGATVVVEAKVGKTSDFPSGLIGREPEEGGLTRFACMVFSCHS